MKKYSVDELANMFDVHPETIRRMLKRGEIKGYKFGREWRVNEDELKKYTERMSNK